MSDQALTVVENFLANPPTGFQLMVNQRRAILAERVRMEWQTLVQRIQRAGDTLRVTWPEVFVEAAMAPYLATLHEVEGDFGAARALLATWEQAGSTALAKAGTLAEEIERTLHHWQSAAVEPMVRYASLLAEPAVHHEATEAFRPALTAAQEQFQKAVAPIVRQNLAKLAGMYGARQTARLKELAGGLVDQARTLRLAVSQIEAFSHQLEAKYRLIASVPELCVSFTPTLPELPTSVDVRITTKEPGGAQVLEGS